jgi:hypothetical protein
MQRNKLPKATTAIKESLNRDNPFVALAAPSSSMSDPSSKIKVTLVNNSGHEIPVSGIQIRSMGNMHHSMRQVLQGLVPLPEQHVGWEMLWKNRECLQVSEQKVVEFETFGLEAFVLTEYKMQGGDDMGGAFKKDLIKDDNSQQVVFILITRKIQICMTLLAERITSWCCVRSMVVGQKTYCRITCTVIFEVISRKFGYIQAIVSFPCFTRN